jgi:hypothetical protein
MNMQSQVLQLHEIEGIKSDPEVPYLFLFMLTFAVSHL